MAHHLTFENLVSLSADEFNKLVMSQGVSGRELMTMITRFEQDVMLKIKIKDGEQHERYQFYNRILRIMYMAMQAEENINFWKNVAIRSKMETEFHKQNAAIYYEELLKYKVIQEAIDCGDLDKYIEEVKRRQTT